MKKKPENPQAFPEITFQKVGDVTVGECNSGMTLRDYFAAAAIPRIEAQSDYGNELSAEEIFELAAKAAYMVADAMLKARKP